jgi:glycosyltransferase involved in cell wall biosynthesis
MRITLVTSKLNLETAGGSVIDLHLKAKSLSEFGHDVTVVTAFSEGNKFEGSLPYRLKEENELTGGMPVLQKGIYRILKKYDKDTDVFYVDGHIFVYGAALYRLFGGKPVVAFFNIKLSSWIDKNSTAFKALPVIVKLKKLIRLGLERTLGVLLANRLDAFVFTTPAVMALYLKFGFSEDKSNIILDFAEYRTPRKIPVRGAHEPILFFTSGRMIPEKGFDLVLQAAALIKEQPFKILMSGVGPELDNLKKMAYELGLSDRVEFPGWVKREVLEEFFNRADVFILPRWIIEYSSVLLIEVMMKGLPVIVPAGGGLEWIAKEGGVTFKDLNFHALKDSMFRFIKEPFLKDELAKKSKNIAASYDYKVLGRDLEEVIKKIA